MKIRKFDSRKDLEMINQWWSDWSQDMANVDHLLSSEGYIVTENGEDLSAAWLYETNSYQCIIGWFVSNKSIGKKRRDKSICFLLDYMENLAKEKGYLISIVYSNIDSMIDRLENRGYIEGDKEVKNLIKILGDK